MMKPVFNEPIFFVGKYDTYVRGIETALPGAKFIADTGHDSAIRMLEDPAITSQIPRGSNLMVFKPAPKIEKLADENHWHLIAPPVELNRRFENKLTIGNEFLAVNLPVIEFFVAEPGQTSWKSLEERFRGPVVVQTQRGHAGSSTVLLKDESDFRALDPDRPAKFSKLERGETWTVNAVVTNRGTLSSRPFLQLQGDVCIGADNEFGTCGNLHKEMDDDLALDIMKLTIRFGHHMLREGYRGWFGLDVLVRDGNIVGFIECNPRLTGSTGVFTEMQVAAGQLPFIVAHVLEHLNIDYEVHPVDELRKLADGFSESHIHIRNPHQTPIKIPKSWKSGVYSQDGQWLRDGDRFSDLGENEVLLRLRSSDLDFGPTKLLGAIYSKSMIAPATHAWIKRDLVA